MKLTLKWVRTRVSLILTFRAKFIPAVSGIALHTSKFRVNLKKNDQGLEHNETRAASTDFEDGFTTTDELDDEIIENTLYIYKAGVCTLTNTLSLVINLFLDYTSLTKMRHT